MARERLLCLSRHIANWTSKLRSV